MTGGIADHQQVAIRRKRDAGGQSLDRERELIRVLVQIPNLDPFAGGDCQEVLIGRDIQPRYGCSRHYKLLL